MAIGTIGEEAVFILLLTAAILSGPLSGFYDVAILRGVLIVLAPDQVRRALENVSRALEPGGAISSLAGSSTTHGHHPRNWQLTTSFSSTSMNHAQLWTEGEIGAWLAEAGFRDVTRTTGAFGADFMVARKPTPS